MLLHERNAGGSMVAVFFPRFKGGCLSGEIQGDGKWHTKDERLTLFCLSPSGALFTCRQGGRQAFLQHWKAEGSAEWRMSRARLVNNNNGSFGRTCRIYRRILKVLQWLTSESAGMLRGKTGSAFHAGNSHAGLVMVSLMDQYWTCRPQAWGVTNYKLWRC